MNKKVARGFDPLASLVKSAHAQGIEVHPYFIMLKGKLNGLNGKFAKARMIDRAGKTYMDWLCAARPEVRSHLVRLVADCLYTGVDGVHLDYIRYPDDARFCYCSVCRSGFRQAHGVDPIIYAPQNRPSYKQLKDWQQRPGFTEWNAWRRRQISMLVREVSDAVRAKRKGMKVSAAAGTREEDRFHVFRDGAAWLRHGLVDFVCPMMYLVEEDEFRTRGATELVTLRPHEFGRLFAGLAAYRLKGSPERLVAHIASARELGFGGVCLFPFEYLDEVAVRALREGPFSQDAVLPWRARNAKWPPSPRRSARGYYHTGLVQKQLGEADKAILSFYAALAIDPKNADALHAIAWTLAEADRRDEAARYFERFLEAESAGARAEEVRAALRRLEANR